uniref:Uncharacterized protein n=1 Tax=Rhizophora mucronata TaxID=61149 RepID=A0A2P2P7R5_RHIMU
MLVLRYQGELLGKVVLS